MTLSAAAIRQNQAAEPGESTWLSANAGSGKTRVLTDRVARLLLEQVKPQNILCLTYTKAAASEMQNRLFQRLGDWAMKPDDVLAKDLAGLGVENVQNPDQLVRARQLFARAIETPGGLRIQTIHSFCAALLRRFPLEAGITPNFNEMDERAATKLRAEMIEDLADNANVSTIDQIACFLSGDDLESLTQSIVSKRQAFATPKTTDEILGWFDLPPGFDADAAISFAFDGGEADLIARMLPITRSQSKLYSEFGEDLAQLDLANPNREVFEVLCKLFLYASGENRNESKSVNFPQSRHKKAVEAFAPILDDLHQFMDRIAAARQTQFALYAAQKTIALHRFAAAFLPEYEIRKQAHGWLDFDDLILKSGALLSNEAVAAWVLYRLDGGLDHILMDEAQDTSPAQWQVIERLAQEFTSGLGARDNVQRTIFVVGDKKQSIYSFQGTDPREFDRMRDHFGGKLKEVGTFLRPMDLEYSFRSSDAILQFVDRAIPGSDTAHRAFHEKRPGRVDLWPAVPSAKQPEKQNWFDPIDIRKENHHDAILARHIADHIADLIKNETIPTEEGQRRRITAGDFLILVRRRSALFDEIIRACKARHLPVAGADRLKLGTELAVKDLSALLSFLATPEDSLSLASALRSPLFGWSEAQLYDLAAKRAEPYLWPALRNRAEEFPKTFAVLRDLRNNADFLRPYDLIERILTRHDGRRNLLARLGPEAEDGIDALLAQSLAYERLDIPSLTGFITWLEMDDVEVKRQMDNAGDLIRVMTVHGAKGMEAPIVILPDTAKRMQSVRDEIVPLEDDKLIWRTGADQQPEPLKQCLTRIKTDQMQEDRRLFYVAVTRAENWLIVAASGDVGEPNASWHQMAQGALDHLGSIEIETPTGTGLRLQHGEWQADSLVELPQNAEAPIVLPDWADAYAKPTARPAQTCAPSDLGGAKAIGGAGTLDEEAALLHGTVVHRLLEILPRHASSEWTSQGINLLETEFNGAEADAVAEALRVLNTPEMSFLFAPGVLSEVDVSAELPDLDGERVAGAIDKLVIENDRILAIDFKTNAIIPNVPEDTPEGLLRQMGAYLGALESVYPGQRVDVAILWTRAPLLMPIPHEIVRFALRRAATS